MERQSSFYYFVNLLLCEKIFVGRNKPTLPREIFEIILYQCKKFYDKVFVVAGGYTRDCYYFDSYKKEWTKAEEKFPLYACTVHSTPLKNGLILISPNYECINGIIMSNCNWFTFDPLSQKKEFRYVKNLYDLQDDFMLDTLNDGRAIVVSARTTFPNFTEPVVRLDVKCYDYDNNTWSVIDVQPPFIDRGQCLIVMRNSKVLFMGGCADKCSFSKKCYEYDVDKNTFTEVSNMNYCRANFSAVLLSNGNIFVTAGQLSSAVNTETCEEYDVMREEWILRPSLKYSRCYHQSVYLENTNELLVIGGTDFKFKELDENGQDRFINVGCEMFSFFRNEWSHISSNNLPKNLCDISATVIKL